MCLNTSNKHGKMAEDILYVLLIKEIGVAVELVLEKTPFRAGGGGV